MAKVQSKRTGVLSRNEMYGRIAARSEEIIDTLFAALKDRNMAVRLGAAKTLINKIIPDLKAMEISGDKDAPLKIVLTKDGFKLSTKTEGSVESAT